VPEKPIQKLSLAAESAFKQLKRSELTGSAARGEESFACQSTPSVQLPRTSGFQFASSFWEDKKPMHRMLDDAYRQNRMSTAAALRHLHSLHVQAPVFGLLWSDGSVRAHVDWCVNKGQEPPVRTMSTTMRKYHISSSVYNRSFVPLCSQARAVTLAEGK
jgi:solute carrier family 25 carnitine/acylcarnitine transporter 20/29